MWFLFSVSIYRVSVVLPCPTFRWYSCIRLSVSFRFILSYKSTFWWCPRHFFRARARRPHGCRTSEKRDAGSVVSPLSLVVPVPGLEVSETGGALGGTGSLSTRKSPFS